MLVRLQREYGQLVTSGAQVALVVFGFQMHSRLGWLGCLALVGGISLAAWASAIKWRRAINDTPTSRIASAAQGYVELQGSGLPLGGLPLLSPRMALPCLWYRYTTEEKDSDGKWKVVDRGESEASFLVDDGSGQCLVDPAGAEILTRHKESWSSGDQRHTEWKLLKGDPIYALGDFKTLHGGDALLDPAEDLKNLLGEWKANPRELHRRFDLNGDGQLDMEEWALARQAARREVEKLHQEVRAQPELNVMGRPEGGQLYLIANLPPEKIARRYGLWALFHLAVFFTTLGGLPWVWQNYPG